MIHGTFLEVFSLMVLWRTTILDNTHILSTQESSYNLEQPVSRWSKLYFHSSMERNLWTLFMIPVFWTCFFSKLLRSPGVRPGKQWGCPSAFSPTWKKTTLPNWLRDDPGDKQIFANVMPLRITLNALHVTTISLILSRKKLHFYRAFSICKHLTGTSRPKSSPEATFRPVVLVIWWGF